ncbi:MAG TPA: hypothetical protein VJM15_05415 [Sphingomicrobium sp.]|nr:hypothetical protein [Sphingomicrobium sp.]
MRRIVFLVAAVMITGQTAAAETPGGSGSREVVYFTIKLENTPSFQVESLKWSTPTVAAGGWAKADGLGVAWDAPDSPSGTSGTSGYFPGNTKYSKVKLTPPAPATGVTGGQVTGGASPPASKGRGLDIARVDGEPVQSGQATGKRQHMPMRMRAYYDQPKGDGPGSILIRGGMPGCAVGRRYAGAQFASAGMSGLRYELTDLVVSDCAPDAVTLDYAKVTVRGWDPKKKEE